MLTDGRTHSRIVHRGLQGWGPLPTLPAIVPTFPCGGGEPATLLPGVLVSPSVQWGPASFSPGLGETLQRGWPAGGGLGQEPGPWPRPPSRTLASRAPAAPRSTAAGSPGRGQRWPGPRWVGASWPHVQRVWGPPGAAADGKRLLMRVTQEKGQHPGLVSLLGPVSPSAREG